MERLKMSNRMFRSILIPVIVVLLIVSIAAQVAVGMYGAYLDSAFGRGERHVIAAEGVENWDTEYYNKKSPEEAKKHGLEVLSKVVDEGMVLLKNDGILPLAKNSKVTPFGKGYVWPFYDSPGGQSSMKNSFQFSVHPKEALESRFTVIPHAANLQPTSTSTNPAIIGNGNSDFSNYPDQPLGLPDTMDITRNSFGANSRIPELAVTKYNELTSSQTAEMKGTTALVFISRCGSEGGDRKIDGYTDGTRHYLTLSVNEKDMIKKARALCGKVVVLVNSTNPIELGTVMKGECEADAILWLGNPGENGFNSMAKILCGEVNPSGRLYDIFASDLLKGPELANFGNFFYSDTAVETEFNWGGRVIKRTTYETYVEYVENMYMGYRYYETAHDIGAKDFTYGELDDKGGVKTEGAICYPFGYGMSYTTFKQTVTAFETSGNEIKMTVKVENTGSADGKEVVQVYYNPPYTDFDKENKVEKPTANLVAFTKTGIIKAGQSETVTLSFAKEDMASYCSTRDNGDGTKGCYMLEAGEYVISLRKDSHYVIADNVYKQGSTIYYDNSNPRQSEIDKQAAMDDNGNILNYPEAIAVNLDAKFIAATNHFDDLTDYMNKNTTLLTRSNWDATVPVNVRPSGLAYGGKNLPTELVGKLDYNRKQPINENSEVGIVPGSANYSDEMPVGNAKNGLTLADMRGKNYYDKDWDLLLNQIDWDGERTAITKFVSSSNYYTPAIISMGLPEIKHCEGANGIRVGSTEDKQFLTTTWCMCPVMAATWNSELWYEIGEAMAQEALANNITSRYSPAFNIHRSPFTGRNLEYYSEDPFLTGTIVTNIINGSSDNGMIEYIKHFGLNDQETNRGGVHTWANEQTVREIYNKPFEMVIRNARKTIKYTADEKGTVATKTMRAASGMMVGQNCLGCDVAWSNNNLMNKYLREECNFHGIINTDWQTTGEANWVEVTILTGTDSWLMGDGNDTSVELPDYNTATFRTALRESLHRLAFQMANSNAMQDVAPGSITYYDVAPWRIGFTIGVVAAYVLAAAGIAFVILRALDEKKNPEKYKK